MRSLRIVCCLLREFHAPPVSGPVGPLARVDERNSCPRSDDRAGHTASGPQPRPLRGRPAAAQGGPASGVRDLHRQHAGHDPGARRRRGGGPEWRGRLPTGLRRTGARRIGTDHSETLMMIGSITKPMTATMAATVVDARDVTWDTPVVDLLPAFAVADPELTRRSSLRNAFCACTGLPQRDREFLFNSATLTPERLITSVRDFPLTAPLGEQFQYSNQLFAIGGYAAAAAAQGQTDLYDAYVSSMQ